MRGARRAWLVAAALYVVAGGGCGGGADAPADGTKATSGRKRTRKKKPTPKTPDANAATDGTNGDTPTTPTYRNGQEAIDAFQAWYAEHPDAFDVAQTRLRGIGRDHPEISGSARMRLKQVEGDRERAAGDWYRARKTVADSKLAAGDVEGALAVFVEVPATFANTSFGAQAKQWPSECAQKVRQEISFRSHKVTEALDAGDAAGARRHVAVVRRLGESARTAFAPQLAETIAEAADKLHAGTEKRIVRMEELARWEAEARPLLAKGQAALDAGDASTAFAIAKNIRAKIGPPEPGESGLRREAEELWIAAATKASGFGEGFAKGVAQKTPSGARLTYDFQDPKQLADWETAKPPARIGKGWMVLPRNAAVVHKARFPNRVVVTCLAPRDSVVVCVLGDHYRIGLWVGRLAKITRGAEVMAERDLQSSPTPLKNPATITITRVGPTITVSWGGIEVCTATDDDPPPESEVERIGFTGSRRGARFAGITLRGDPQPVQAEVPTGPVAPEQPEEPPAPDLPPPPRGWKKLRPVPPGLSGWTAKGHGRWSARQRVEVMFDGGRKRERLSTLVHELPGRYAYSEYELVCEMRFVKHRNGSSAGLMFPIAGEWVIWLFDDEEPAELIGAGGVMPRGTLATGTQAWMPVKVRVKGGKAIGYIGRGKAWEIKLDKFEPEDLGRMPQTGLGLVSRGGVTVFRNPAIKFYK